MQVQTEEQLKNPMPQKVAPEWLQKVVSFMFRFTVGAFGISPPRPMRTGICGPFWLGLLGCTAGLPVVILGWTIRLIFGQGRAERWFEAMGDGCEAIGDSRTGKILGKILLGVFLIALIGGALALIGFLIYLYGWFRVSMYGLAIAGGIILLISLVTGAYVVDAKFKERARNNPPKPNRSSLAPKKVKERKPNPTLQGLWRLTKKVGSALIWFPKHIGIVVWQVLVFIGLMLWSLYKKSCPLGEI